MLHVRLVLPDDLTDPVLAMLEGHPSVVDVVEVRGAGINPPGDLVTIDVLREGADTVLTELRRLGVDERGTIAVDQPQLVLSRAAQLADSALPGTESDAVLWQEVKRRTSEDATLTTTYTLYMVAAMLIAAIGIMTDSPILIVAAMVVGPDFGPTAATAVGVTTRSWRVARRAFGTLLAGFGIGIAATTLFTAIMTACGLFDRSMILMTRPQTNFIYQPGVLSLVVALIAGCVGMLSLTTSKSGALIGVFISVTTIPAASNLGVALFYGEWREVIGSGLQLVVNILGIQLAAALTLIAQHRLQRSKEAGIRHMIEERREGA